MNEQAFHLNIDDDQIAWLAIDVPGSEMNTLKAEFIQQVNQIVDDLQNHAQLQGLIIYSTKKDNFIAGADIHMLDNCQTEQQAKILAMEGQQLFARLQQLSMPVVAAIHGVCLGGGLELALACDYRICTQDDNTRLGVPEVKLGLLPGSGGTQRLPRLIGLLPALNLILTGKTLSAAQAVRAGLVDSCVPQAILFSAAKQLLAGNKRRQRTSLREGLLSHTRLGRWLIFSQAAKKAQQKSADHYPAIKEILRVMRHGLEKGVSPGLEQEAEAFARLVMSSESKALRALFLASTAMKKEHCSNEDAAPLSLLGIIGGGLMGAGIAYVCIAKAGLRVRIKDITHEGIVAALRYSYQRLNRLCKRGTITQYAMNGWMQKLEGGTDYTRFKHMDIVVEAVFEELELKQQVLAQVEENASEHTIFATNTSSIPIRQIAQKALRPQKVVGLHYFSPVDKMPLVEVIPHETTSAQTIAQVVSLARLQGKTPIVVKDSAGFYVNRILVPYMLEAAQLLLAGEPIEHIDNALVAYGFPVGPLTLLDEVGFDIGARIIPVLCAELGERFNGADIIERLIDDGRKGRKNGKGFYRYYGQQKKRVDKRVYRLLSIKPESALDNETIAQRCVLLMLNEAVRCLDDGVIASARDGDIGAVFGIGFPPFLGGPFRYIQQQGIEKTIERMNQYTQRFGARFAPCEGLLNRAGNKTNFYSSESAPSLTENSDKP